MSLFDAIGRALTRRGTQALVRRQGTALVKVATRDGAQAFLRTPVAAQSTASGFVDVITGVIVEDLPPRVNKVIGRVPSVPARQKVLLDGWKAKTVAGVTAGTFANSLWDLWHASGISPDAQKAVDTWLQSKGIRAGDPLPDFTPEDLAALTELIAKSNGGQASEDEIADFVVALTRRSLGKTKRGAAIVPAKGGGGRLPPTAVASSSQVGAPVEEDDNPVVDTELQREIIEKVCSMSGTTRRELLTKLVLDRLEDKIDLDFLKRWVENGTPSSSSALQLLKRTGSAARAGDADALLDE